jgi:hypothetical protein
MIGRLLSIGLRVVTLPVDIGEIVLDRMCGGDGSRKDLKATGMAPSDVRDQIAELLEEIDR